MAQITLHLKHIFKEGQRCGTAQPPAEFPGQRLFGQVGDMRHHTRDRKPLGRDDARFPIAPAAPIGIGMDGGAAYLMKGYILRRMMRGGGNGSGGIDRFRIGRGPFQHLHAAHGTANHGKPAADPKPFHQALLRAHHVADRHRRKIRAPRPAKPAPGGIRHFTARPGGAHAAAQHIGADQKVAIRIQRPAGADDVFPPAGLAGDGVGFGDILIARQRMADQHCITGRRIQAPIGAIGDLQRRNNRAAFQRKPIRK